MAQIVLPFSRENKADNHDLEELYRGLEEKLPAPLKSAAEENPHILNYLRMVPLDEVGIPKFVSEPSRKLGDDKTPNYLYPTNNKGIFVHILNNPDDARNSYIPVEPTLTANLDVLARRVEHKLLELRERLPRFDPDGDLEQQMIDLIDKVTTVQGSEKPGFFERQFGFLRRGGARVAPIRVTPQELMALRYLFIRDKLGLGPLETLISDPYIEDISCSGRGQIFIEHKIFKSLKSMITFETYEELDEFVLWLSERIKKPVTYRNPIVDATLPDGSRINIVFGKEVSRRGSNFTVRKFAGVPVSIFELVEFGSINYQMLAYLSLCIGNGMNVFVSGETASGKTTLLNALTTFIHPMAKVVSIEDTPELQVPHQNWIREVVQTTNMEDDAVGVNMFDLLKAALRQRPNEILVGEIRGPEGNVAFQAMQTGHSVMATFHAASVEKLIQRLTGHPILVPKSYVENLNIVILTSMVKLPNGKTGRRVTGINEIVAYDPAYDSFTFVESFHWDEATDTFEFVGYMSSFILENKVAPKIGLGQKKQRVYAEVERRAKILEKLHREQKITNFYEVLRVLSRAQRQGLF